MRLALAVVSSISLLLANAALAESNYPDSTVRILAGFPPGGPPDLLARLFADGFSQRTARPVIVENVTGAGGNIAVDRVTRAAPDGYTLAVTGSSSIVISPSLFAKLSYNPLADLEPVSAMAYTPIIIVVRADLPVGNLRDLSDLAAANPGEVTFGSAGVGTPGHLAGEMLKSRSGMDIRHVAYRGIPAMLPDLISGRVTMAFTNNTAVMPQLRDGTLRAIATTSARRLSSAPAIPTIAEAGFPGFKLTAWTGLMAPARTPISVVETLNREIVRVLRSPDNQRKLEAEGMELIAGSPGEFSALIKAEIPEFAAIVRDAGIKPE